MKQDVNEVLNAHRCPLRLCARPFVDYGAGIKASRALVLRHCPHVSAL